MQMDRTHQVEVGEVCSRIEPFVTWFLLGLDRDVHAVPSDTDDDDDDDECVVWNAGGERGNTVPKRGFFALRVGGVVRNYS